MFRKRIVPTMLAMALLMPCLNVRVSAATATDISKPSYTFRVPTITQNTPLSAAFCDYLGFEYNPAEYVSLETEINENGGQILYTLEAQHCASCGKEVFKRFEDRASTAKETIIRSPGTLEMNYKPALWSDTERWDRAILHENYTKSLWYSSFEVQGYKYNPYNEDGFGWTYSNETRNYTCRNTQCNYRGAYTYPVCDRKVYIGVIRRYTRYAPWTMHFSVTNQNAPVAIEGASISGYPSFTGARSPREPPDKFHHL